MTRKNDARTFFLNERHELSHEDVSRSSVISASSRFSAARQSARKDQLPSVFVLVVIGLILILLALTEYLNERLERKP